MKKNKKLVIISSIFASIAAILLVVFLVMYFTNPNRLTASEKRFLAENSSIVQNIAVLNNASVFGNNGTGVFFDFLEDFSKKYGLQTNPVTFNLGESRSGISFTLGNTIGENEFLFYEGHYVLVSKQVEYFSSASHLTNQKIGLLSDDVSYVSSYLDTKNLSFNSYSTKEDLLAAFKEQKDIQYMIVPMYLYMEDILANDFVIACHFRDIPYYYKVNMEINNSLGSILKKYFNEWKTEALYDSYKEHLFDLFVKSLNISLTEIDAMRSISYNYGFVDNSPYEILTGGNYGGIIAQYLKEFTDFSETEIHFTRYKNVNKFVNAIQNNKVDMYFSYYDLNNDFLSIPSGLSIDYSIVAEKEDDLVIHSLKSLNSRTVYVEENSLLYTYLKNNSKAILKTYKTIKELKKITKKGEIVVIDSHVYSTNPDGAFNGYNVRFKDSVDTDYTFKLKVNESFTKLFTKFVNTKDPYETTFKGLYNYDLTFKTGTITGAIAKYFMYILVVVVLVFLYVYRLTKKVKVSKKIKKEDKLKYIDQLTSLKNRNYFSENLDNWSQNTIYPQTVVVIDLNNLQYINDTMGYEKGDEQIKAAANILVKNQLDNSDIIRTDGNEFVVYLIGYQTKQITSYIHKLNKEFKRLPYEQGAAIGYSMIEDNLKTIEDAMNEAVEEVKKQKGNKKEGI